MIDLLYVLEFGILCVYYHVYPTDLTIINNNGFSGTQYINKHGPLLYFYDLCLKMLLYLNKHVVFLESQSKYYANFSNEIQSCD